MVRAVSCLRLPEVLTLMGGFSRKWWHAVRRQDGKARWVGSYAWLVLLVGVVLAVSAAAAPVPTTSGTTRVLPLDLQDPRFVDRDLMAGVQIDMRWRFGVLMGEPLREFSGTYTLPEPRRRTARLIRSQACIRGIGEEAPRPVRSTVQVSALELGGDAFAQAGPLAHSLFRARITLPQGFRLNHDVPHGRHVYLEFRPDTLLPAGSPAANLSLPSSPRWDEVFKVTSTMGEPYYLSAAAARDLYRQGVQVASIEFVDPEFSTIDLRLAHERRVRETCGSGTGAAREDADQGPREEAATHGVPGAEPVAERLRAALGRAQGAERERRGNEAAEVLEAKRLAVGERHAEAYLVCEASGPSAPVRELGWFYLCEDNRFDSPCARGRRRQEAERQRRHASAMADYETALQQWQAVGLPDCQRRADVARDTELALLDTRERERARISGGGLGGTGTGVER